MKPLVDKSRRVLITPEGVPLPWSLGSISERATAFLIDIGVIAATMWLVLIALLVPLTRNAFGVGDAADEAATALVLLLGFALRNLYFAGWELTPRGATPGKRVMKLRVAARDGGRLTAGAVFARNATRELEVFLPLSFIGLRGEAVDAWTALLGLGWSAVFLCLPLFNRDLLRAGDLLAGTWVVRAPRRRLLRDLTSERFTAPGATDGFQFSPDQVDAYGVKELQVLEAVLRGGQGATLKDVAVRIRGKIDWTAGPSERDRDFLEAYYAALRRRLESQLLFGRRRRDKHDRA